MGLGHIWPLIEQNAEIVGTSKLQLKKPTKHIEALRAFLSELIEVCIWQVLATAVPATVYHSSLSDSFELLLSRGCIGPPGLRFWGCQTAADGCFGQRL